MERRGTAGKAGKETYMTREEQDEAIRLMWADPSTAKVCPTCGARIAERVHIGRSLYLQPCGHRVGQIDENGRLLTLQAPVVNDSPSTGLAEKRNLGAELLEELYVVAALEPGDAKAAQVDALEDRYSKRAIITALVALTEGLAKRRGCKHENLICGVAEHPCSGPPPNLLREALLCCPDCGVYFRNARETRAAGIHERAEALRRATLDRGRP